MRLPSRDAWVFSCKTYLAAMLALYIALSADLARPGWAVTTVFIASQPLSGATVSKSVYRFFGTLIGAVATVVLVPNLVETPELLSVALAAWVSICLYFSLQDRSPRSYVFMLAGYSAALIGFPGVESPQDIFTTAVSRVEEITLGITCSSLVHNLIFPNSVANAILHRVDKWLEDSRLWCASVLRRDDTAETQITGAHRRKIANYPVELETLTSHLSYDSGGNGVEKQTLLALHRRLELLLPILSSIEDRLTLLRRQGSHMPSHVERALDVLAASLKFHPKRVHPKDLPREILSANSLEETPLNWERLAWAGVVARVQDLLHNLHACNRIRENLVPDKQRVGRAPSRRHLEVPRHVDQGMALLSSGTAFIAILAGCAFWILSGWPDGASVPMIGAVCCSFFATLDSPLPSMMKFGKYAVLAVIISIVYSTTLLPAANCFEVVALLLAPAFLWLGVIMASPATSFVGMVISTNMSTLLGLNNRYSSDFAASVNGGLALVVGIALTAIIMSVIRARTPQWSVSRIVRSARGDLIDTIRSSRTTAHPRLERDAFIRRMLDRVHLVMPRLAIDDLQSTDGVTSLLPELRLGVNIIDLERLRSDLPATFGSQTAALTDELLNYLNSLAVQPELAPPNALREQIDAAIFATSSLSLGKRYRVLLALSGIRLILFPHSSALSGSAT
ncbi:FUSC family protein [Paraburkholderia sp. SG-MS1]|uniref:FUSC family protein n=1 Tax=Paraburkholderia sp. SG-MS1 TaxID=2023741 RepID=UPI001445987E|nr:FUSC family protein [Paraburkholderia sp. SG-MS1]